MSVMEQTVLSNQALAIKTLVSICQMGTPKEQLLAAQTLKNNGIEPEVVERTFRGIVLAQCFESLEAAASLLAFDRIYPSKG